MTKLNMLVLFQVAMMSSGIIRVFHAASISSFDVTPTCFCTKELAPVCDNYGVEYSNICAFHCINQQNSSIVLGCSHSCPCEETTTQTIQTTSEPVPFTRITNFLDDITKVTKSDPQFDCFCTKEFAPVCDIQGIQYSNMCTFRCLTAGNSSITLACNHKCPCEEVTQTSQTTLEPVTSTRIPNPLDDVTKNPKSDPQFDCFCTKELAPVCDIQGRQYSNICTFRCLTAGNSSITLACNHKCPCEEIPAETTTTTWETDIQTNFTIPEQGNEKTIL